MSEVKPTLPGPHLIQIGVLIFGLSGAWFAMDAKSQVAMTTLQDHEARMRTLERDVLGGLARIEQRMIQLERNTP